MIMQKSKDSFSNYGFMKTYFLTALLVLLIPVFSYWFFHYAQDRYDRESLSSIVQSLQNEKNISDQERSKAITFFQNNPLSKILVADNPKHAALKASLSASAKFNYAVFRWMIIISLLCIYMSVGVFVIVCLSVLFSLKSQLAQFWSLSIGWFVLRLFSTLQVLGQGCLAIALSFWVTALWTERYYPKLILVIAIAVICAVGLILKAIFKKMNEDFVIEGQIIEYNKAPSLWQYLEKLGSDFSIEKPDQIIGGIDDNFFVTEVPVIVGGNRYNGKTLYISLSLLKSLRKSEANAVLAHELAHFMGSDTVYTKKILPLLSRYDAYLQAYFSADLLLHAVFLESVSNFSQPPKKKQRTTG